MALSLVNLGVNPLFFGGLHFIVNGFKTTNIKYLLYLIQSNDKCHAIFLGYWRPMKKIKKTFSCCITVMSNSRTHEYYITREDITVSLGDLILLEYYIDFFYCFSFDNIRFYSFFISCFRMFISGFICFITCFYSFYIYF